MDKFEQAVNAAGGAAAIEADTSYYTKEDPDDVKIVSPLDYIAKYSKLIVPGAAYKINTLTEAFKGYCMGTCTIIFAESGKGKTTLCHGEIFNLMAQGIKVGMISTEETIEQSMDNLIQTATGTSFDRVATDNEADNNERVAARKALALDIFKDNLLFMPEDVTRLKLCNIVRFIEKCAAQGIKHIFLDNVTMLASKSDELPGETWQKIEKVTTTLTDLARRKDINILVIGHTNSPKHEINQYKIKGGQSLANAFDNIICLMDAEREPERDEQGLLIIDYRVLEILKSRQDGRYRGTKVGLRYDANKHCITEDCTVLYDEPDDRTVPPKRKKVSEEGKKESCNFNVRLKSDDELIEMGVGGIEAYVKEHRMDGFSSTKLLERHERISNRTQVKKGDF